MSHFAIERLSVEAASERLPESERWVGAILGRVEPWSEAIEVARQLAEREGCEIDIRAGTAEAIPFEDASFDVVIATSVIEHVEKLQASLAEVHRVLCPGGVFWFNAASAVCPRQEEIARSPLFGRYPDRLKHRIMMWAKDHAPQLIAHRLLRSIPVLKLAADIAISGCSFGARKRGDGPAPEATRSEFESAARAVGSGRRVGRRTPRQPAVEGPGTRTVRGQKQEEPAVDDGELASVLDRPERP
jgi:SAM-dependent methyltransferase